MALKIKVFPTKHQSSCSWLFHQSHSREICPSTRRAHPMVAEGSQAPWLRATKCLINCKGGLCFIANSQHFTQVPQCLLATKLKTSSIPTVFSTEIHINPTNLYHPLSAKNAANSCIYQSPCTRHDHLLQT